MTYTTEAKSYSTSSMTTRERFRLKRATRKLLKTEKEFLKAFYEKKDLITSPYTISDIENMVETRMKALCYG